MNKNIIKIFYFFFLLFLFFLVLKFYLSEQNITLTSKSRSSYLSKMQNNVDKLPLLKNDTINIIEYKDDVEIFKKNKKYNLFWELIGK